MASEVAERRYGLVDGAACDVFVVGASDDGNLVLVLPWAPECSGSWQRFRCTSCWVSPEQETRGPARMALDAACNGTPPEDDMINRSAVMEEEDEEVEEPAVASTPAAPSTTWTAPVSMATEAGESTQGKKRLAIGGGLSPIPHQSSSGDPSVLPDWLGNLMLELGKVKEDQARQKSKLTSEVESHFQTLDAEVRQLRDRQAAPPTRRRRCAPPTRQRRPAGRGCGCLLRCRWGQSEHVAERACRGRCIPLLIDLAESNSSCDGRR